MPRAKRIVRPAAGTGIALPDHPEIGKVVDREIPSGIHIAKVVIFPVGPHDAIGHAHEGIIGDDPGLDADGAGKAAGGTGDRKDHDHPGQFQVIAAEVILHLDFVDLLIAADQNGHGRAVGAEDQGLDHLLRFTSRKAQTSSMVLTSGVWTSSTEAEMPSLPASVRVRDLGLFEIRRVLTGAAEDDGILAGIGHDHEFVGITAADASRIRLHRPEVQTAAREDPVVGIEHLPVTDLSARLIRIETVGVLHAEFPAAHHPETGADLVAEFRLDLIEIYRKLPVGFDLVADQIGDHLLVGRPETVLPVMTIPEAEQFLAVMDPASRFLPEFRRLHHGQKDLLGSGPVHLLPDDLFDLADHPVAQGQIGIDPRWSIF